MSIIDTLITDRTAQDVALGTAKGHYNATDLNRVGEATRYIADRLNGYGYAVSVTGRSDWTVTDIPRQGDMDTYLGDIRALREAIAVMESTPEVPARIGASAPGAKDGVNWARANDIEKILEDLDLLINNMAAAWFYCGEIFCGEV